MFAELSVVVCLLVAVLASLQKYQRRAQFLQKVAVSRLSEVASLEALVLYDRRARISERVTAARYRWAELVEGLAGGIGPYEIQVGFGQMSSAEAGRRLDLDRARQNNSSQER